MSKAMPAVMRAAAHNGIAVSRANMIARNVKTKAIMAVSKDKKPKAAHRVTAFPLNSTGKIAKRVLRDRLESGGAVDEEQT